MTMRAALILLLVSAKCPAADDLCPVPLTARVAEVQPMTGIVVWTTNPAARTAPIQLVYSYLAYDQVVREKGEYDWSAVEKLINEVAARKHQLVLRWHDTYVGKPNRVPAYNLQDVSTS